MTLNPARPVSPRRLLTAAMLMALAASLSSAHWTPAASPAPSKEAVCKCAHCPGGALCCCHDSACAPH